MIKALIFDFDGLILDTESPEVDTWNRIYQEHGFEFPFDEWVQTVGGFGTSNFDAADHIAILSQGRLDSASIRARHRSESDALALKNSIMPGVADYLHEAKRLGIKLGIASSSQHAWVDMHAKRLGIFDHFDTIVCSDDVGVGRTKPHPDLYLLALKQLQVQKNEALVFEDSPNGIKAANRAGIFVVAVPNPVTSRLNIQNANLILSTLSDLSLSELLNKVQ
ncbi:MAG: HAD family phosphatase [Anaerolineales bacterium]|nr:HAD family phosphatase [Anaerolineales bacterium]